MRNLLRIVGSIWAIIGVANIYQSSATAPGSSSTTLGFVIMFNIGLFIFPGLIVAGIGSVIRKKENEKVCPVCAEKVKAAAKICRFCNAALT